MSFISNSGLLEAVFQVIDKVSKIDDLQFVAKTNLYNVSKFRKIS